MWNVNVLCSVGNHTFRVTFVLVEYILFSSPFCAPKLLRSIYSRSLEGTRLIFTLATAKMRLVIHWRFGIVARELEIPSESKFLKISVQSMHLRSYFGSFMVAVVDFKNCWEVLLEPEVEFCFLNMMLLLKLRRALFDCMCTLKGRFLIGLSAFRLLLSTTIGHPLLTLGPISDRILTAGILSRLKSPPII